MNPSTTTTTTGNPTTTTTTTTATTTTESLPPSEGVEEQPPSPPETTTNHNKHGVAGFDCKVCRNDSFQDVDIVTLAPCGCRVCKDCYIHLLALSLKNKKQERCCCASCQTVVLSHSYRNMQTRELVEYTHPFTTSTEDHLLPHTQPLPPPEDDDDVEDERIIQQAVLTAAAEVAAACMQPMVTTTTAEESTAKTPNKKGASNPKKTPSSKENAKIKKKASTTTAKKRKRASTSSAVGGGEASDNPEGAPRKKRKNWKFAERLAELRAFQEQFGHCNVRRHDGDYQDLGNWLYDVIRGRRKINEEQRQQILDLGVDLTAVASADGSIKTYNKRKSFAERLADLQDYKRRFGHVHVPYRPEHKEDQALAEWVKDVRRGQIKINMTQRQQLNKIGFNWETKYSKFEREWNDKYKQLIQYRDRHGHTRVALNDDKVLYEWCNTQRKLRNKNQLRQDRKERLDQIGFWDRTTPHVRNNQLHHDNHDPEQPFRGNNPHHPQDDESSAEEDDDDEEKEDNIHPHHHPHPYPPGLPNELYQVPPSMMVAARRTNLNNPFFRSFGV